LVGLGAACRLRVTAEGVETENQANALLSLGCTSGQGMYFHAPLPADDISALLR
jgi:EAL domain-containing protein (putative c-di-GMP-specific phosphodiesterase class I)